MADDKTPAPGAPGRGGAPLPPIRFADLAKALLDDAASLLAQWLPDGAKRGHEYVCGSLSGGKGSSCSVNTTTGAWADFSTGEQGGDLLSLYAAINGLTMGKAALQVAHEYGLEQVAGIVRAAPANQPAPPPRPPPPPKVAKAEPEGWTSVVPVPAHALAPTFKHFNYDPSKEVHRAEYRVGQDLYGYIIRFLKSDGGKETLPYHYCQSAKDGGARWHWKQWDEPRPLYLPGHRLPDGRTVILVEGEKKADALQTLLDAHAPGVYCVASWPGGCKAWKKADWNWLAGCTVLLWPDCDAKRVPLTPTERKATPDPLAQQLLAEAKPIMPAHKQPGMGAMLGIGALLRDTYDCTVQLLAIPEPGAVVDGWDCGDAIAADGWDGARVVQFLGTAYALPADVSAPAKPAAAAGDGGGGKKIDPPVDTEGEDDAPAGGAAPWWLLPYWNEKKSFWMVSRKLVISALRHDEKLQGIVGLNELTNNIDARRPWPWKHGEAGPIKGSTSLMLGQYLSDSYGLPSIAIAALEEAVTTVAQSNRFHPVREYLQALQWDKSSRIDKWLVYVLGESPKTLPPQLLEYLSLVGRFMLLGMVHRAMEPGCKFDYAAVLEGAGGLGKSTFVEVLASTPFFSNAHFDLTRGKEGQEQVQGVWVYELQELSSIGKAELNLIKAFISSAVDRYRPSYGRTVEAFARQCIMIGTTNEDRYLRDRTGNRRWWPIPVRHVINNPWLEKYRDQLLAEAFALYQQGGVPYTPSREQEAKLFVPMQESRLEESAVQSELMRVLTRESAAHGAASLVNGMTDFVTNAQLVQALGVDAAKSSPALVREIGSWMKHQGWELKKRMVMGARVLGYVRPGRWPAWEDDKAPEADDWTTGALPPAPPTPSAAPPAAAAPHEQDDDDAPF